MDAFKTLYTLAGTGNPVKITDLQDIWEAFNSLSLTPYGLDDNIPYILAGCKLATPGSLPSYITPGVIAFKGKLWYLPADSVMTNHYLYAVATPVNRIAENGVTYKAFDNQTIMGYTDEDYKGGILLGLGSEANLKLWSVRIADNSITPSMIPDRSLPATKLETGTITRLEIGQSAVTTFSIASGAVTTDKIAANAVVQGKIAYGAVGEDQIGDNVVHSHNIANNTIWGLNLDSGVCSTRPNNGPSVTLSPGANNKSISNLIRWHPDLGIWDGYTVQMNTSGQAILNINCSAIPAAPPQDVYIYVECNNDSGSIDVNFTYTERASAPAIHLAGTNTDALIHLTLGRSRYMYVSHSICAD
jgi:hypothetical protein